MPDDGWEFVDPEDSGIPPDDFDNDTYWYMATDMEITDDEYALEALYAGWFDENATADMRMDAREQFFDYMDMDSGDFDWDEWREFYDAA